MKMNTRTILIGGAILLLVVGLGGYLAGTARASGQQQFVCPTAPAPFVLKTNETITIVGENTQRYLACGWVGGDPLVPTPQP
jgi:hypothetical protein